MMIELDVQLARNSYLNSRILPIRAFFWRRSRTKPDINVIFILQPWISTDVTCENVIREIFIKREGSNMREGWHFKFLWIHQNRPDLVFFSWQGQNQGPAVKSNVNRTLENRGHFSWSTMNSDVRLFLQQQCCCVRNCNNYACIYRLLCPSSNQGSTDRFSTLTEKSGPVL